LSRNLVLGLHRKRFLRSLRKSAGKRPLKDATFYKRRAWQKLKSWGDRRNASPPFSMKPVVKPDRTFMSSRSHTMHDVTRVISVGTKVLQTP
jgi:hypothetical protein